MANKSRGCNMNQSREELLGLITRALDEICYKAEENDLIVKNCGDKSRFDVRFYIDESKCKIKICAKTHRVERNMICTTCELVSKLNQIAPLGKFVLDVDDFGFEIVFSYYGIWLDETAIVEAFLYLTTITDIAYLYISDFLSGKITKEQVLDGVSREIEKDQIGLSDFDEVNEARVSEVFGTIKNALYGAKYKYKENNHSKTVLFFVRGKVPYMMLFSIDRINRSFSIICSIGLEIENESKVARALCYISAKCDFGGFFQGEGNKIYYKLDAMYPYSDVTEDGILNLIKITVHECDKYLDGLTSLKSNLEGDGFFNAD